MKNIRIFTIASAALLAASCSEPVSDIRNDKPQSNTDLRTITLRATHDTPTRTDFDGAATTWVEGDAMSVIFDNGTEQQARKFTLTDIAEGMFEGDMASFDPEAAYDIYAVYPYNELKTTASNKNDKASFAIGAARQTQHGASASHVAAYDPLTGSVLAVTSDNISLRMHHTATLIRLELRNATGSAISGIASAKITAPEGTVLAAAHTIDLTDGTTAIDDTAPSNTIELTVKESDEIAAGETFTLWAAAAPFEITTDQTLNIDITTADGVHYGVVKAFGTEKRFAAGTIMSSTVDLAAQSQTNSVFVDFSSVDFYPETFPTSANAQSTTDTHIFGGREFKFDCPGAYYFNYYENDPENSYLMIKDITDSDAAYITLPVIEGYAPTAISLQRHESSKTRNFQVSVIDGEGNILDNTKALSIVSETNTYEPVGTNDHDEYRIRIIRQRGSKLMISISSLAVTYTPYQSK